MRVALLTLLILFGLFVYGQNALHFDGTNDGVNCGTSSVLNVGGTSFAIEAWIYADNWQTNVFEGTIAIKENNSNNGGFMFRAGAGGKVNLAIGAGTNGSWSELTTAAILNTQTWYHVAGTYDGSYLRIFVNGVQRDSLSASLSCSGASSIPLTIGYHPTYSNRVWSGKIDEVRIWDTTLTAAQILANMNSEFCSLPVSKLVGYFKLDAGKANSNNSGKTTAIDYSGNGNNATLSNFALSGTTSNWVAGVALDQDTVELKDSNSNCSWYYDSEMNQNISSTGTYSQHFVSYTGCDSMRSRYVTILENTRSTLNVTVCDSFISPVGKVLKKSGTYYDVMGNKQGCDSIIKIELKVGADSGFVDTSTCLLYTSPKGINYTKTGTYFETHRSSFGCDSFVRLNITIFERSYDTITLATCDSIQNPSKTRWLKAGDVVSDTLVNRTGCDSVIVVNVSSLTTSNNLNVSQCKQYVSPSGKTWTTTGVYNDTIPNMSACDSLLTIDVTILQPSSYTLNLVGCDFVELPNTRQIVFESGTFYDTLTNARGCDSVLTINATVNTVNVQVKVEEHKLTAYSTSGSFQWLDCEDNFSLLASETNEIFEYKNSGSYAVEVTDKNCIDTSMCYNLTGLGLSLMMRSDFVLYPNPSTGQFAIRFDEVESGKLKIYNSRGQIIYLDEIENLQSYQFKSQLDAGIYLVYIEREEGVAVARLLVL
ncbi:MAG: hypothetical protein ACI8ZN_000952 [Bacteroidia bacterium]|jgi:hypothetical protein